MPEPHSAIIPSLTFLLCVVTGLAGCSAARNEAGQNDNSPMARQCATALDMAAEEIDNARGIKGIGAFSIMRASHTHGSAKRAQYRGNYQECVDNALKSQRMIREAYRAQAKENAP